MLITGGFSQDLLKDLDGVIKEFDTTKGLVGVVETDIVYDDKQSKLTYQVEIQGKGGVSLDSYLFEQTAKVAGLPKGLRHRTFNYGSKVYRIVGVDVNDMKYPLLVKDGVHNVVYKFKRDVIGYLNN